MQGADPSSFRHETVRARKVQQKDEKELKRTNKELDNKLQAAGEAFAGLERIMRGWSEPRTPRLAEGDGHSGSVESSS